MKTWWILYLLWSARLMYIKRNEGRKKERTEKQTNEEREKYTRVWAWRHSDDRHVDQALLFSPHCELLQWGVYIYWRWMKKIRDILMMARAILQSSFGLNHLFEEVFFSMNQLLIEKIHSVNKLLILFYSCSVFYRFYSAYTISESLHFKTKPTSDNNISYILLNKKLCKA